MAAVGVIGRLTTPSCPDCGVVPVDRHLKHDDTCPLGRAADRVMEADRRFFAEHPGARRRFRPISRAEVIELRIAGVIPDGWSAAGDVEVTQLSLGVRTRRFGGVWMFPREVVA